MRIATRWIVVVLCLLPWPRAGAAEEATAAAVPDTWVEEALEAAGAHRAALESVLAHYRDHEDPRRLVAARFLIANMPGHGYVVAALRDAEGREIPYDPLAYDTYAEARDAIDALEKEHGNLDFDRTHVVLDVETIEPSYLIEHIDRAFEAWGASPAEHRVSFDVFLEHVLPYRGSEEPLDQWISPLRERYATWWADAGGDVETLRKRVGQDVHQRVRFNERYYLHPTDQGFSEMVASGQGRCEDITNMMTYASRSLALATAADYTPAWAHRDNNHAWNVLLDAEGHGHEASNAHAAKVYRKTFSLQRDGLAFQMGDGEEPPNRFLASTMYVDVTDQYRATTDVTVRLDPVVAAGHRLAYLCVFNGGQWVAIHGSRIADERATFDRMGRAIAYLPAVFEQGELVPAAPVLLVHANGTVQHLTGAGGPTALVVASVRPEQASVDTQEVTPVSWLEPGVLYRLQRWTPSGWAVVGEQVAADAPLRFEDLSSDGLYWMVADASRRLERIFTIQEGRPRWW